MFLPGTLLSLATPPLAACRHLYPPTPALLLDAPPAKPMKELQEELAPVNIKVWESAACH